MPRLSIPALLLGGLLLGGLAGCSGGDKDSGGDTGPAPTWSIVAQDQPAAFLSIMGTTTSDVWAVGADAGTGPAAVHYDGTSWTPLALATTGDLWWIASAGGDSYWMAGAGGRVLHYSVAAGLSDEQVLDAATTFFGIWPASDTDVWAVGGDINSASDTAQVWHYDGTAWTQAALPDTAAAGVAIYKVWGRSATDVYAVGTGGIGLHWDGTSWSSVSTGTENNLFTVSGTATDVWAVGGDFTGEIRHESGGTWSNDSLPAMSPQINGVYAGGPDPAAVGAQGAVYSRIGGAWTENPRGRVTIGTTKPDLHSVWVDPDGGIWAVGGHLASFPLDQGVIVYGGDAAPASF